MVPNVAKSFCIFEKNVNPNYCFNFSFNYSAMWRDCRWKKMSAKTTTGPGPALDKHRASRIFRPSYSHKIRTKNY